jgi:hypothetical protein
MKIAAICSSNAKKVKPIWRNFLLEDIRLKLQSADSALAMFEMISALSMDQQYLVLILLWDWWTTRNKKNTEGKELSANEVCHLIQRHVLEFQMVKPIQNIETVCNGRMLRWQRPSNNQVKVNFDAAFVEETGEGAWGFVARSDKGVFIAAAAGRLKNLRDALQAEAEACVAASEGANRVVF